MQLLKFASLLLAVDAVIAAQAPRVVLVSVDGLRADVVNPIDMPHLAARGVRASRAINDMPSATLPNHATLLTGLTSDRHGVNVDFRLEGKIAAQTVFDRLHAAGLRSAFFGSKTKLGYLVREETCERVYIDADVPMLVDALISELRPDGPDFVFAHLREPDSTGHAHGWLSPEYMLSVAQIDQLLGQISQAVEQSDRPTFILVTADHGGEGGNHFLNVAANREIPWVLIGPGIVDGTKLPITVETTDSLPTVLHLLGQPIPAGLSGRVVPGIPGKPAESAAKSASLAPVGLPCILFTVPGLLAVCAALHRRQIAPRFSRKAADR